jgi:hypothetical protein
MFAHRYVVCPVQGHREEGLMVEGQKVTEFSEETSLERKS